MIKKLIFICVFYMLNITLYGQKIEMIELKAGMFYMGSQDGERNERPVHRVMLNNFYIGKYEVTQKEWKAIMGNNPSKNKGDDFPVENVSWYDVQKFIEKLNKKTGKNYRLPTEAEWEYAATGGATCQEFKYAGSNCSDSVGWVECSVKQTQPVGQKRANALGIYDMSGNVWEWCSDWYDSDYYSNSPRINPDGPIDGEFKIIRGGCNGTKPEYCRSASRLCYVNCDFKRNDIGFRLACD